MREQTIGHVDSGWRCLVAHYEGSSKVAPPCIKCERCRQFIRPQHFGEACPGIPSPPPERPYRLAAPPSGAAPVPETERPTPEER